MGSLRYTDHQSILQKPTGYHAFPCFWQVFFQGVCTWPTTQRPLPWGKLSTAETTEGWHTKENGGVQLSFPFLFEKHSTWWWWIIMIQRFGHMFTVKMAVSFISCWRRCLKSHKRRETLLTPMVFSCTIKNFSSRVALEMTVLYLFFKLVLGGSSHFM